MPANTDDELFAYLLARAAVNEGVALQRAAAIISDEASARIERDDESRGCAVDSADAIESTVGSFRRFLAALRRAQSVRSASSAARRRSRSAAGSFTGLPADRRGRGDRS